MSLIPCICCHSIFPCANLLPSILETTPLIPARPTPRPSAGKSGLAPAFSLILMGTAERINIRETTLSELDTQRYRYRPSTLLQASCVSTLMYVNKLATLCENRISNVTCQFSIKTFGRMNGQLEIVNIVWLFFYFKALFPVYWPIDLDYILGLLYH